MKSHLLGLIFALTVLLSGCQTAGRLVSFAGDWAVGVYQATTSQIRLADERASKLFDRMTPSEKEALKADGTRYLAVRTEDPNPAQMQEIRRRASSPGGGTYARPTSSPPKKVYCVMVWDTVTQEVVGTECYAVFKLPAPGQAARFDTYTTQFVGSF